MPKIENISLKKKNYSKEKIISLLKAKEKIIPTKYLYDDIGSKLFEKICETEEYYLTRTEQTILNSNSLEIVNEVLPLEIFEFGSGSSKKTKTLILHALKKNNFLTYYSFDISTKALDMSYYELSKISRNLDVKLIKGDFNNDISRIKMAKKNRLYLFLGSTLGNFNNEIAIKFLNNVANLMKKDDCLLLGVDKVKDEKVINLAYNDSKGVTKEFNKNILNVINREYKLNFNEKNFLHNAKFNTEKSQIEMYLESTVQQSIKLSNNEDLNIEKGEKILTEISRKFSESTLNALFEDANLEMVKNYTDSKKYFSLYLLKSKKCL